MRVCGCDEFQNVITTYRPRSCCKVIAVSLFTNAILGAKLPTFDSAGFLPPEVANKINNVIAAKEIMLLTIKFSFK